MAITVNVDKDLVAELQKPENQKRMLDIITGNLRKNLARMIPPGFRTSGGPVSPLTFERREGQWFEKKLIPQEKKTMSDEAQPPAINRRPEEYLAAHMLRAFHDDDYVEALGFAKLLAGAADELRDDAEANAMRLRAALAQLAGTKDEVEALMKGAAQADADLKAMTKSREQALDSAIAFKKAMIEAQQKLAAVMQKWDAYIKRSKASKKGKKRRA